MRQQNDPNHNHDRYDLFVVINLRRKTENGQKW